MGSGTFGEREKRLNHAVGEFLLEWSERVATPDADSDVGHQRRPGAHAPAPVAGMVEAGPLFAMFIEALAQSRRTPELRGRMVEHYARRRALAVASVRASAAGDALSERTVGAIAAYMVAVADGLQLQALLEPDAAPADEEIAALLDGLAAAGGSEQALRKSE